MTKKAGLLELRSPVFHSRERDWPLDPGRRMSFGSVGKTAANGRMLVTGYKTRPSEMSD